MEVPVHTGDLGGHSEEDVRVEAVHMPHRGGRPRSGLDHEPRTGSAAARPSGGHGPGTDIYAPVDTGAQHGHGGRPDEAVSAPQDHRQHSLWGDPDDELLPGRDTHRQYPYR